MSFTALFAIETCCKEQCGEKKKWSHTCYALLFNSKLKKNKGIFHPLLVLMSLIHPKNTSFIEIPQSKYKKQNGSFTVVNKSVPDTHFSYCVTGTGLSREQEAIPVK